MIKTGCCGFGKSHAEYFRALPLLEVQKTFYQPPRTSTADRWRAEAPKNFEFTVKAWQLMTHEATSPTYRRMRRKLSVGESRKAGGFRWNDLTRQAWEVTVDIARRLRADKIVFQTPASFHDTEANRDRLRTFFSEIERDGLICIWEPRGWGEQDAGDLCADLGLVHCVDPFKDTSRTLGMRYYRLHGLSGYYHNYTAPEFRDLLQCCHENADNYVLFNNVSMFDDACRFRDYVHASSA